MSENTEDLGKGQAKAQLENIQEMIAALEQLESGEVETVEYDGDPCNLEDIETRIGETPLSVEVRGGWHSPGEEGADEAEEYQILLCTGGPAVRIVGDLAGRPDSARLEYQDWGTPWTPYYLDSDEESAVMEFASRFLCY